MEQLRLSCEFILIATAYKLEIADLYLKNIFNEDRKIRTFNFIYDYMSKSMILTN